MGVAWSLGVTSRLRAKDRKVSDCLCTEDARRSRWLVVGLQLVCLTLVTLRLAADVVTDVSKLLLLFLVESALCNDKRLIKRKRMHHKRNIFLAYPFLTN